MSVEKRDETVVSPNDHGGILTDEKPGLHVTDTETSSLEHQIERYVSPPDHIM